MAAAATSSSSTTTKNLALSTLSLNSRFTAGETPILSVATTPISSGTGAFGTIGTISGTKLQTPIVNTTTGLTDALRSQQITNAGTMSVLNLPLATSIDVTQQTPIVGKSLEFRNVSVAERLKSPSRLRRRASRWPASTR